MTDIQCFMLQDEMELVSHYCHVIRAEHRV